MVLVDEGVAGLECGYLALVVIDADDVVANLGETDGRDQTDVTRANNCDLNAFAHGLRQMVLLQCNADSLVDFRSNRKLILVRSGDPSQTGVNKAICANTICFLEVRRVE